MLVRQFIKKVTVVYLGLNLGMFQPCHAIQCPIVLESNAAFQESAKSDGILEARKKATDRFIANINKFNRQNPISRIPEAAIAGKLISDELLATAWPQYSDNFLQRMNTISANHPLKPSPVNALISLERLALWVAVALIPSNKSEFDNDMKAGAEAIVQLLNWAKDITVPGRSHWTNTPDWSPNDAIVSAAFFVTVSMKINLSLTPKENKERILEVISYAKREASRPDPGHSIRLPGGRPPRDFSYWFATMNGYSKEDASIFSNAISNTFRADRNPSLGAETSDYDRLPDPRLVALSVLQILESKR